LLTKFVKFTLLLLGICVLSAAPVFADQTHTFTFTSIPNPLGTSQTYMTTSGLSLTVSGFAPQFVPRQLNVKTGAFPEEGLGLVGGASGGEISAISGVSGIPFIQLDIGTMLAGVPPRDVLGVSISMDSIQSGDSYAIRAGNAAHSLGTVTLANNRTAADFNIPISNLEGPSAFRFFNVSASTGSVLLEDVEVVTTPEPSSVGLLLIGLGALVGLGAVGRKLIV
jgi:hypothetical protein